MAELARLAGVSPGTVSRALSGSPLVKAKTRDHIRALAKRHNFRPNQTASQLRRRTTGVIGIIIPMGHDRRQNVSDPFFMSLLGHLADALTDRGYRLMLSRVLPDRDDWLEEIVESGLIDGAVLIGQSDQLEAIERVATTYLPLVAWGSVEPGQRHCAVGTDNLAGGKMAAAHLLSRGRRRLAFLGDTGPPELAARYRGAVDAAALSGVDVAPLPCHLGADEMRRDIARKIETIMRRFDGVFCASDLIAANLLWQLAEAGAVVPRDVSVVGYDDLALATQISPALTTLRQDLGLGATIIVDALLARIRGEAFESVVMQPALIVRQSA